MLQQQGRIAVFRLVRCAAEQMARDAEGFAAQPLDPGKGAESDVGKREVAFLPHHGQHGVEIGHQTDLPEGNVKILQLLTAEFLIFKIPALPGRDNEKRTASPFFPDFLRQLRPYDIGGADDAQLFLADGGVVEADPVRKVPLGKEREIRRPVLGGGLVGCETGLYLAEHGRKVSVIEMQDELAPEANWMHKEGMRQDFEQVPITTLTGHRVTKIVPGEGVYTIAPDGGEKFVAADSIVYAMGMRANKGTVEELSDIVIDTIPVGDCVAPRKARQAMEEAFWAVIRLA
jgi:hypothetical protein